MPTQIGSPSISQENQQDVRSTTLKRKQPSNDSNTTLQTPQKLRSALRNLSGEIPYASPIATKQPVELESSANLGNIKFRMLTHPLFKQDALITTKIDQGSFGKARIVVDIDTGKILAAKEVRFGRNTIRKNTNPTCLTKFTDEVRIQNQLNLPCGISGAIRVGERKAIILQECLFDCNVEQMFDSIAFLDNRYLAAINRKRQTNSDINTNSNTHGIFTDNFINAIGHQVSKQLANMHAAGYVHGDIKADNIFGKIVATAEDKQIFQYHLADFGFSHLLPIKEPIQLGSPLFQAPETMRRVNDNWDQKLTYNEAIDVWSFGQTLLQIICTQPILIHLPKPQIIVRYREMLDRFFVWKQNILTAINEDRLTTAKQDTDCPFNELLPLYPLPRKNTLVFILEKMLAEDPQQRPSAAEVSSFFKQAEEGEKLSTNRNEFMAKICFERNSTIQARRNITQNLQEKARAIKCAKENAPPQGE